MHNNYYFIRQLSAKLKELLKDAILAECFSQNKDELILSFVRPDRSEFYILANLGPDFSCLYFPENFNRAKRNSINLFTEIINHKVEDVVQAANERLFFITFNNDCKLVFKLFGNRSNILLFQDNNLLKIFKNNLRQDKGFNIENCNRLIDVSFENFRQQGGDLKKTIPTLGDIVVGHISSFDYDKFSLEEKYNKLNKVLQYLETPDFFVTKLNGKIVLSLFKEGEIISTYKGPIEAINDFYNAHYRYNYFDELKNKVLAKVNVKIKNSVAYSSKCTLKLEELENEFPIEKIADIIMANLHNIPKGSEKVTLFDFYNNRDIEIKLKDNISPQKNAEQLYKKSKNRPVEINRFKSIISSRQQELADLEKEKDEIEKIKTHKELDPFITKYISSPEAESKEPSDNFKYCEYSGFKIYVGKNAANNDELTQKFAHKDDLWLHAKDVSGSHVVIKNQAGKNFPKNVIEKAASLAAYYSKRKNDSLCPVIYTQKKNVRKVKGAPKGAVKVERENVIMVVPSDF